MVENKVTVTIVEMDGAPAPLHVRDLWSKFMAGHWTCEAPILPGRYLTADDEGVLNGEILAYTEDGEVKTAYRVSAVDALQSSRDCWRWSEAYPAVLTDRLPMRQIMKQMLMDREARNTKESKPLLTLVPPGRLGIRW